MKNGNIEHRHMNHNRLIYFFISLEKKDLVFEFAKLVLQVEAFDYGFVYQLYEVQQKKYFGLFSEKNKIAGHLYQIMKQDGAV